MIPSRGLSKITGDLRSFAGISREFVSARGPLGGGLGRGATDAHLAERRYQSRSDDWLYRSLRRYVLRGGEKRRTRPRGRRRDAVARVANEGGERRGRLPLSPPDTTGSPTRSGSSEAGSSTKPCSSFSL